MPYMSVKDGDGYYVYKQDSDGKKTGEARNKKPMTEEAAKKYMAALYANESKSMTDAELIDVEEKCYSDYGSMANQLSPTDPRANYDAMAGRSGAKACANCRWFHPGNARCDLIYGEIVASGLSSLWLAKTLPEPANVPTPMPVYLVEPVEAGADSFTEAERKAAPGLLDKLAALLGIKGAGQPAGTDVESGFKIYPDGRWVGWYTNNAQDKAKEWFPAKAIDQTLARVKGGAVPYPELWFKHYPMRMGKADYAARIGYLTLATGTFYDTPVGKRGRAHLEAEQKAGHKKTMSHGFLYPRNLKSRGMYGAFNTFEISVLDPGEEANPYTLFEVKAMFKAIDSKGLKELADIFGEDEARKLANFGETESKKLEDAGVSLKGFDEFGDLEIEDKEAQAGIKALTEATIAGFKGLAAKIGDVAEEVKAARTDASTANAAVTDLKAFVEKEFGYTPRASKSVAPAAAANPAQVDMLKAGNKAAASDLETPDPTTDAGAKSIFDFALEAAGLKKTV